MKKNTRFTISELWTIPRRNLVLLLIMLVLALGLAWEKRFIQDDAFISFTYARSLVQGEGLTWFGTKVEGYTNFLWVLWSAAGIALDFDPVKWSYLGGLFSLALCIVSLYGISFSIFGSTPAAFISLVILLVNHSFISYATGGLETMLQTALLCAVLGLFFQNCNSQTSSKKLIILQSFLIGLALLTRLDSALPAGIIVLFQFASYRKNNAPKTDYLYLLLPGLLLVMPWLIWKYYYYGRLLPNTFYLKLDGHYSLYGVGLRYVWRFFHWYFLWPFLGVGILIHFVTRQKLLTGLRPPLTIILFWLLYVVSVGGDFMEFRFLVPIVPYITLFLTYFIYHQLGKILGHRPIIITIFSILVLVIGSYRHTSTFRGTTEDKTLDSIPALATYYGLHPDHNWAEIGLSLKQVFQDISLRIAVHQAGALPFYSELESIDMWGLNDLVIPRQGSVAPANLKRPGHQRHARLSYLRNQKVNIIIGKPILVAPGLITAPSAKSFLEGWIRWVIFYNTEPITQARIIGIPINSELVVLAWYLTPTAELDALIASEKWEQRLLILN